MAQPRRRDGKESRMLNRYLSLFLLHLTAAMRHTLGERGQSGTDVVPVGVVCASCASYP